MEREISLLSLTTVWEPNRRVKFPQAAAAGVAFISQIAARESLEHKKVLLFRFPEVQAKRLIYLIYHKERVLSPAARNVIRYLREYCTEG